MTMHRYRVTGTVTARFEMTIDSEDPPGVVEAMVADQECEIVASNITPWGDGEWESVDVIAIEEIAP